MIRISSPMIAAGAVVLLGGSFGYARILSTSASARPDNALIVEVQVTTGRSADQVAVTYLTDGVEPLVSRWVPVSATDPTTITIGRLRANRTYAYTVRAIDKEGGPAGTAEGTFTTGPLPAPLSMNTYTLTGRTTVPLVILPDIQAGWGFSVCRRRVRASSARRGFVLPQDYAGWDDSCRKPGRLQGHAYRLGCLSGLDLGPGQ